MEPVWRDPLWFAVTCLGAGAMPLCVRLGWHADKGSRLGVVADLLLALLAFSAAVFSICAAVWGFSLAIWGSAGILAAMHLILVILPIHGADQTTAAAPISRSPPWGRLAFALSLWAMCPFVGAGLAYTQIKEPEVLTDMALSRLVDAQQPPAEHGDDATVRVELVSR